jgi:DNA-binding response OmpR family regulator
VVDAGREFRDFLSFSCSTKDIFPSCLLARVLLRPFIGVEESMRKPVVLLAERNPELQRSLFTQLSNQGYEVINAPTMVEVLRALRRRRCIDLFVLSVSLTTPGDGVELTRLLRQGGSSASVILLAEPMPQCWAADARSAGAAAYFARPFSCEDVVACIMQICASSSADLSTVGPTPVGFSSSWLN